MRDYMLAHLSSLLFHNRLFYYEHITKNEIQGVLFR